MAQDQPEPVTIAASDFLSLSVADESGALGLADIASLMPMRVTLKIRLRPRAIVDRSDRRRWRYFVCPLVGSTLNLPLAGALGRILMSSIYAAGSIFLMFPRVA